MDPILLEARAFGFFRKHKTGEQVNAASREPHYCEVWAGVKSTVLAFLSSIFS